MHLKSLELAGYKTFASKTTFEFAQKITAVVGPNGSGKSNIADALRWVLGEQSYSLLRGKRTEDMIFSGSEQRPRAGMASASVVFDNSTGWLPIDFSEVSITRRAYRDGQNEYLINGQKVRLRDVAELLGRSGLSERTYTIIGQGLVDAALSLKADERRKLFEEAAGIGLYRSRRAEALRRLDSTRRNLERVQDILSELKPRLNSLERQARRAREYDHIKADLQVILREWYGFHWHRAQKELKIAREAVLARETSLQKANANQASIDQKASALRTQIRDLRARLNDWHLELAGYHRQRESISRDLAVSEERQHALEEQGTTFQTDLVRLEEEHRLSTRQLEEARQEVARLRTEAREARQQNELVQTTLEKRLAERQSAEKNLQEIRQELDRLARQQVQLLARRTELESRVERQQNRLSTTTQALEKVQSELAEKEARRAAATKGQQQAGNARLQAEKEVRTIEDRLNTLEKERGLIFKQQAEGQAVIARLQAQLQVLEQAEHALVGYASGTKRLLQAARASRLVGTRGALSSQLRVPAEYEAAIAASLGTYLDAFLLEAGTDPGQAIRLLDEDSARAAILPLGQLTPPEILPPPSDPDCLGSAADLVEAPPDLRPVTRLLLGNVWVVKNREAAARLLSGQPAGIRAATLQGTVYHSEGPILAGGGDGKAPTLSRPRQKREIIEILQNARQSLATLSSKLEKTDRQIEALEEEKSRAESGANETRAREEKARTAFREATGALEKARHAFDWQAQHRSELEGEITQARAESRQIEDREAKIAAQIEEVQAALRSQSQSLASLATDELQAEVAHWEKQAAVANQAANDARNRQHERQQSLQQIEQRLRAIKQQLTRLEEAGTTLARKKKNLREQEKVVGEQITAIQALVDPAEEMLRRSEKELEALQARDSQTRQKLTAAERYHAQAQITLARRQEALDTLRRRIEDDFGLVAFEYADEVAGPTPLPLDGMVEKLPRVTTIAPEAGANIKRLRAQLRRMGAINPEAQKEYQEVKERYEFMITQVADLEKAEADLKEVIAELDVLMEREFRKTFDAVAAEFRATFTRLFGGGSARLVLTNPENLTDTGVEIEARLPGRRTQGLSLLSGGERSLTASALVFSLLKVSPPPFCVLDEVDAMLDEANVNRFTDLLGELSQNTQFIIITHNRNTVQVAEIIYGITMGRDSASQVLGLKLDEVAETLKA